MSASWSPSPLIPPFRFGTVEQDVYRGAYPKQRNLRYLKRLKLKTILSLIPDPPDEVFRQFCTDQGIKSIHLPVDKVKDNVPLTYNRAVEAVQVIIDPDNLPIYVHCLDGASVTGLVICCLRKLQTWNISSAMGEFLRYLRGGVISSEESVFVEKFASEIEISKSIPPWLWEGQVTFKKHPTLKLNFTIPPSAVSASNSANNSASSPTLSSHGVVVAFPNPQNEGYTGNTHSNSSTGSTATTGTTISNANAGGIQGQNSTISGTASGAGAGSSLLALSTGLINHASRSSAKASLRDRPSNNKSSIIRTDVTGTSGYGSRSTSIATPTTAALARNKRAMVGVQSALAQQQPLSSQDSSLIDNLGPSSGLGVRLGSQSPSLPDMGPGLGLSTEALGKNSPSVITAQAGEPALGGGGEESSGKDHLHTDLSSGHRSDDSRSNDVASVTQLDRTHIQHQSVVKTSPAPTATAASQQEPVEEYYEVSMALKALALEGADF
ncbi:hypothetical protein BGX28_003763 [Mortierella sp. GBA30]|nr:hypothetical protein BGX28_003763 [Mortierella sp. GBA30]